MDEPTGPAADPTQPGKPGKKRRIVLFVKRASQAAFLLLIALVIFLGASHQGRASVKAALSIPEIFDAPVKPLQWFAQEPIVEEVIFPIRGGADVADLYRPPGDGPFAGVVLFPGIFPHGSDDPRVARLGKALARSNMVTMIYWSPTMAEGRMEPEDIHNLVAAFEYLSGRDYVDPERVGIGGFCIGASYSIMAAAQEPIREQVAFVNAFGPYFHLPDLLAAITSRTHTYGDVTQDWKPDKLSLEVYVNHMTEDLPENERSLLREGFNEDAAIPDDAIQSFSDEGKAVHTLLLGVPGEEVDGYRSRMPAETLERGDLISPSQYVDDLAAPLLIMHDRKDRLVPVSESRRLRDSLADRGDVHYTEFGLFRHVTPDLRLGPWDTAKELGKLFLHLHAILMQST